MFDILSSEWTTDLLLRYEMDQQEVYERETLDQARDLGYESYYTIKNLGSLGLFMAFYFMKLIVYVIVKTVMKNKYFEKWEKTKEYLEKQK